MKTIAFTVEQMEALCGGELPQSNGFDWKQVTHFEFKDGVFQPYAGSQILPGPCMRGTNRYPDGRFVYPIGE
ncbi:MAG: hypothetical protein A2408_03045 [Candidatus Yonathbacteria bacterium RIFOXYC1_FULL_52_10]|uniref:Uncharacterized protein n=1 Tax=Candidatus Yonathbacteria bacterium RIFOXYD1_FULL_52_36 TaxID=1802730 RepID=A0A1G2SHZ5_9BACT|nr:MAG: hypothetical protein A2408_03045 [Candidatus Yonathbacteria bacterium RIFOXYC1_FULL_52_10]OHA84656.1 MAG: hypothetical protein A2591_02945 [Candidatus Yonathbacteria bacterium RIFOXYD1_FULL_52_36]